MDQDIPLAKVRDFLIKNVRPSPTQIRDFPRRIQIVLRHFSHLIFDKGLIIFVQPIQDGSLFIERVVVPLSLYDDVFHFAHVHKTVGHKGIQETIYKINKYFYMPFADKYVGFKIANCVACLGKRTKPKHTHKLETRNIAGAPLELVFIDHIGPLNPMTLFNNRRCSYVLIMVDAYSRFIFTYPVEDTSTKTLVKCIIDNFLPSHGLFRDLKSDRGSAFTSKLFNELMLELGINHFMIPVRNPNSNISERYNRFIYDYIKTIEGMDGHKNWGQKLMYANFCANTAQNSKVGRTPFEMFYNRTPVLPIELFCPKEFKDKNKFSETFEQLQYKIEEGWKCLQKNSDKYMQIKNIHRIDKLLHVNTLCYVYFDIVRSDVSKKLSSKFLGPFIITKRYSQSLYQVQGMVTCPITNPSKFFTVARDKIVPISTQLKLCSKETYSMKLTPSAYISANDVINVRPGDEIFDDIENFDYINDDSLFQESVEIQERKSQQLNNSHSGVHCQKSTGSSSSLFSEGKLIDNEVQSLEQVQDNESEINHHSLRRSKSESDKESILNDNNLLPEDITLSKSEDNVDKISLSSDPANDINKSSKRGRPKGSKNYSKIVIPVTSRVTRSQKKSTKQLLSEFSESLMSLVKK
ncbi:MAG: transposase family protein [Mesoflavibacter sp.]|nr:transposase family protein [Mesoflavibacter sp.]